MKAIDISPEGAEDALLLLGRHVPAGVELGRPMLAQPDDGAVLLATTVSWWWVNTAEATRLLPLSGGRVEVTTWRHGDEVSRSVGAV